jgi:hypothetical protein
VRKDAQLAGVLGIALAATAIVYLFGHAQREALLILLTIEILGGREASIPAGLAQRLDWRTAATAVSLIELTSLFLLFPLLVALAAGLRKMRWLDTMLARARAFALRNPDVDVLALGALTLMPFLPVGALTSVLIGELLRLPSRYLLPTLAVSLVLANVITAYAMDRLISIFPDPQLVAGVMTGLLLVGAGTAWAAHRFRGARPN